MESVNEIIQLHAAASMKASTSQLTFRMREEMQEIFGLRRPKEVKQAISNSLKEAFSK